MALAYGKKCNWFAKRRRLVAQPGGLTLGFVLHLVIVIVVTNAAFITKRKATVWCLSVSLSPRLFNADAGPMRPMYVSALLSESRHILIVTCCIIGILLLL